MNGSRVKGDQHHASTAAAERSLLDNRSNASTLSPSSLTPLSNNRENNERLNLEALRDFQIGPWTRRIWNMMMRMIHLDSDDDMERKITSVFVANIQQGTRYNLRYLFTE